MLLDSVQVECRPDPGIIDIIGAVPGTALLALQKVRRASSRMPNVYPSVLITLTPPSPRPPADSQPSLRSPPQVLLRFP